MAVKNIWTIDHACGHQVQADLSDRPADRRAGYARWLADRNCTDCWRASRTRDSADTAAWREAKQAAEQAEAEEWAARFRMPPLEGTDKAVSWGDRCRHQLVTAAYTALVADGDLDEDAWAATEDTARTLTRAGWWIDQREADPSDLPELLDAATDRDRSNENPHF